VYNLADLTRMAGIKRRTVQLWAEGGVLIAEPASERQGSGVHRTFSRNEAIVCLILSRFAQWNLPIGQLIRIALVLRAEVLGKAETCDHIERAIRGEATVRLTLDSDNRIWLIIGTEADELAEPLRGLGPNNETLIVVCLDRALTALRGEARV